MPEGVPNENVGVLPVVVVVVVVEEVVLAPKEKEGDGGVVGFGVPKEEGSDGVVAAGPNENEVPVADLFPVAADPKVKLVEVVEAVVPKEKAPVVGAKI